MWRVIAEEKALYKIHREFRTSNSSHFKATSVSANNDITASDDAVTTVTTIVWNPIAEADIRTNAHATSDMVDNNDVTAVGDAATTDATIVCNPIAKAYIRANMDDSATNDATIACNPIAEADIRDNADSTHSSDNAAVSVIRKLSLQNKFTMEEELDLIQLAFANDRDLILLVNHYDDDLERFMFLVRNFILNKVIDRRTGGAVFFSSGHSETTFSKSSSTYLQSGASSRSLNGGMNLITFDSSGVGLVVSPQDKNSTKSSSTLQKQTAFRPP